MADVVQRLEHRIVVPKVVGSDPIVRPQQNRFIVESGFFFFGGGWVYNSCCLLYPFLLSIFIT